MPDGRPEGGSDIEWVAPVMPALPNEHGHLSEPTAIPRDFWREVPCGHPQDPIAAVAPDGHLVCHCGWGLDDALPFDEIEGRKIVACGKCGCYPALPNEADRG